MRGSRWFERVAAPHTAFALPPLPRIKSGASPLPIRVQGMGRGNRSCCITRARSGRLEERESERANKKRRSALREPERSEGGGSPTMRVRCRSMWRRASQGGSAPTYTPVALHHPRVPAGSPQGSRNAQTKNYKSERANEKCRPALREPERSEGGGSPTSSLWCRASQGGSAPTYTPVARHHLHLAASAAHVLG